MFISLTPSKVITTAGDLLINDFMSMLQLADEMISSSY